MIAAFIVLPATFYWLAVLANFACVSIGGTWFCSSNLFTIGVLPGGLIVVILGGFIFICCLCMCNLHDCCGIWCSRQYKLTEKEQANYGTTDYVALEITKPN